MLIQSDLSQFCDQGIFIDLNVGSGIYKQNLLQYNNYKICKDILFMKLIIKVIQLFFSAKYSTPLTCTINLDKSINTYYNNNR